jgi:hypothetical protein
MKGRLRKVKMARILAGCVAENTPLFFQRAQNLVHSIRWFGGTLAEADIVVCMVEDVRPEYRESLEAAGARVVVVPRWTENPLFNKIQVLKLPNLDQYETVMILDCDMIVTQDLTPFVRPDVVQSKIADVNTVPYERFERACARFGLPLPPPTYRTTVDRVPILRYCNTGVLFGPPRLLSALLVPWTRYELALGADPSLLGDSQHHRGQASFALAMIEQPTPFEELPVALNFPLNQTQVPPTPEMLTCDPVILHYHNAMEAQGYLRPTAYPLAQERIRRFNARLAAERRRRAGPMAFCIGASDSGTTPLRTLLNRHPDLAMAPETHFIPEVARGCRLASDPAGHFVEAVVGHQRWPDFGLDAGRFRERVAEIEPFDVGEALRIFYQLYAEQFGKRRGADETPIYALHVEEIQQLLPEARFVHVIRDGRDVAGSAEDGLSGPRDAEELARQWVGRVEAVRRRAHRLRHYLEVRYEDLLESPEAVLRQVCRFLELRWDRSMLGEDAPARPWRREITEERQARFEGIAGPLLAELGHDVRQEAARPPRSASVAVCVAGMHRSGTSVVAALLDACGVLFSDRESLLAAAPDNPLGYWEDPRFVAVNEAILAARGGAWDAPPDPPTGWEQRPELLSVRARASDYLKSRIADTSGAWGFKDPRATLTLSLWKSLVPRLRLIVCLRNPLEVSYSLARRHKTSTAWGLQLWERYYRALQASTTPDERLLVRYDVLERKPAAELQRMLDWLGVPVSPELVAVACEQVVGRLRHHHATSEDLVESDAPDPLVSLYLNLRAEAEGDGRHGSSEREAALVPAASTREEYRAVLRGARLDRQIAEQAQHITALQADNDALRALATDMRALIAAEKRHSQWLTEVAEASARERAGDYAALRQHAEALSAMADLRLRQYAELEGHTRTVEAALEGQRLRRLFLRMFRFSRRARQPVADRNA